MRSQTMSSMDMVLEDKLEAFKGYLIFSEETGPLPYRVTAAWPILAEVLGLIQGKAIPRIYPLPNSVSDFGHFLCLPQY